MPLYLEKMYCQLDLEENKEYVRDMSGQALYKLCQTKLYLEKIFRHMH